MVEEDGEIRGRGLSSVELIGTFSWAFEDLEWYLAFFCIVLLY